MKMRERFENIVSVINDIEQLHEYQNFNERVKIKTGYYGYIPLTPLRFISLIEEVSKILSKRAFLSESIRFLEIGCGIGIKMNIAKEMLGIDLNQVEGIEVDSKMVKLSKYFTKSKIHNIDAFDFKNYSDFNIVYYYVPIANHEIECKLERLIEDNLKVGSFIIAVSKHDMRFKIGKNYKIHRDDCETIIEKIAS